MRLLMRLLRPVVLAVVKEELARRDAAAVAAWLQREAARKARWKRMGDLDYARFEERERQRRLHGDGAEEATVAVGGA